MRFEVENLEHNKTDGAHLPQDQMSPDCTPAAGGPKAQPEKPPKPEAELCGDAAPLQADKPEAIPDDEREPSAGESPDEARAAAGNPSDEAACDTVDLSADPADFDATPCAAKPSCAKAQSDTGSHIPQVVEWLAPDDAPVPPELCDLEDAHSASPLRRIWERCTLTAVSRWLLMVLLFIILALGASLTALYLSVDAAELPPREVRFAGQQMTPTAYRWRVPVAGPVHRTLKKHTEDPLTLETVTMGHPELKIPEDLDSQLTLWDADDEIIFEGTPNDYQQFSFTENGLYRGELTLSQGVNGPAESFEPVGSYTYAFSFQLEAQPLVEISSGRQVGGSVIGIRVQGLLDENPPRLESELGDAIFVPLNGGWAAYLPVSAFQDAGDYTITVHAGDYVTTHTVTVSYRQTQDIYTFTADGTALAPYLGEPPRQVQKLFGIADPEAYWANSGFMQPLSGRTVRNYEVMEHIDNVVDPALLADPLLAPLVAEINKVAPSRHSLNVTFQTRPGTEILCPADGRVVYTGTVNGGGRCIAVEHGCGLKSVFYLLANYKVKEGDYVSKGALLGTTQGHTICEVWLNNVPLCPWEVWGGYGGLFF